MLFIHTGYRRSHDCRQCKADLTLQYYNHSYDDSIVYLQFTCLLLGAWRDFLSQVIHYSDLPRETVYY